MSVPSFAIPKSATAALSRFNAYINGLPKTGDALRNDDIDLPSDPAVIFRAITGFDADPWQAEYLRRTDTRPGTRQRNLLLTSRQIGKSTVVGVRAAIRLLRWKNQEVIVLAKTDMQAGRLSKKIQRGVAKWIPRSTWPVKNLQDIELPNGSTLTTLPGGNPDGIRGFSPTLLLLDEAAFVSEDLIAAVSPMLARTRGDWDMLSSANGPSGSFYEAAEGAQAGDWHRTVITADDVGVYEPEYLAAEKRKLGEARFLREYYCRFLSPEGSFFSLQSIDALLSGDRWPGAAGTNGHRPDLGEAWDEEDLDEALNPVRHADKKYDRLFDD